MSDAVLDAYVEAWPKHTKVTDTPEGTANLEAYLDTLSDDVTYTDVPSGHGFSGKDGITELCRFVSSTYDVTVEVVNAQTDGERFAMEFESTAIVEGAEVKSKGVAVGTISDGKITSHRDYHVTPGTPEAA